MGGKVQPENSAVIRQTIVGDPHIERLTKPARPGTKRPLRAALPHPFNPHFRLQGTDQHGFARTAHHIQTQVNSV